MPTLPTWEETTPETTGPSDSLPSWDETSPLEEPKQEESIAWKPLLRSLAAPFVQAPIDLAQAPKAAVAKGAEVAGKAMESVQEPAGDLLINFLRDTGLDPSAHRGLPMFKVSTEIPMTGISPLGLVAGEATRRGVEQGLSEFTTPENVASLPAFALKPFQAAFQAQSILGLPQSAEEVAQSQSPQEAAAALTRGAVPFAVAAGLGVKQLAKGQPYAPPERIIEPSREPEYTGTAPGTDLRPNEPEVRQAEGEQAGNRNRPVAETEVPAEVKSALTKPAETAPAIEAEKPKGVAASVRNKWTSATEQPFGSEAGFINLDPLRDMIEGAGDAARNFAGWVSRFPTEELRLGKPMNDFRTSLLKWSQRLQTSFQEASQAQKDILKVTRDRNKLAGITNWIQADGDPAVLQTRLAATTDAKLRKGYEAALNLTPEEIAIANDIRNTFAVMGNRGQANNVLSNFKDNYVTQIWNLGKGPTTAGPRTLQNRFRFNQASKFPTYFEGEQAGYTPKTKDISRILPMYIHEMNQVIAARQMVQDLSKGVASDGRPLVAPKGRGEVVTQPAPGTIGPPVPATMINPNATRVKDTGDYKEIPNQPALHKWNWVTKDASGNNVFMNSDLVVHPEVYGHLKNVLGKSAIREWYDSPSTPVSAIPKAIVKGLDNWNAVTKQTMLGLISPFHQVQEGTHAIGHRVNPFWSIPKIDLVNDAGQRDAASHGLMLAPDKTSAEQFMNGLRPSGLVSAIPGIGELADGYSNYLFHQYIPGLKFKTYEAILERNRGVYKSDLAKGKVTDADVKHLSAEQANAAYGHLNYTDFGRNPTVLHALRVLALAPDFLEARARFAGQALKGATGAKVGREQLLALGFLAISQAAVSYIAAKLTGGEWDAKHPFEFHVGNRRFAMRSVPEDISSLINDPRSFAYSRISPIIGRGLMQYGTGVDWRSRKVTPWQTTKDLLAQPIPISVRGFLGIDNRSGLSGLEQLASSAGLRISRYSPSTQVFDMAKSWMESNPDPKVQARLKQTQATVYPESEYKNLRLALQDNNTEDAKKAYRDLLRTKSADQIDKAMRHSSPFTGSKATDEQFSRTLQGDDKRIYLEALRERREVLERFNRMKSQ